MSKLQLLREAVMAADAKIEADQLFTFLRDGNVIDTGTGVRYEATAIVVLTDWRHAAHPITLALVRWLRTREGAAYDALKFEADMVSHDLVDLHFELPFTETVVFDGEAFQACAAVIPDPNGFLPR